MGKYKYVEVKDLINPKEPYKDEYIRIQQLVESGDLAPVKNSKFNGRVPPLYNRYRKPVTVKKMISEPNQMIGPNLSSSYYMKHPKQWNEDKDDVLKLQDWLNNRPQQLEPYPEYIRSAEIFGNEKTLSRKGEALCTRLKIDPESLVCYPAASEIKEFVVKDKGTILITENLAPYDQIRNHLAETNLVGVLYGQGWNVANVLTTFLHNHPDANYTYLYWGDLDPEGIRIYETLVQKHSEVEINPCTLLYQKQASEPASPIETNQKPLVSELFLNQMPDLLRLTIQNGFDNRNRWAQEIIKNPENLL